MINSTDPKNYFSDIQFLHREEERISEISSLCELLKTKLKKHVDIFTQIVVGGSNQYRQLCLDNSIFSKFPTINPALKDKKIIQFRACMHNSWYLTKEGEVYACGNNQFKWLNEESGDIAPLTKIPLEHKVIKLAKGCSFKHQLFLTEEGRVFSFGPDRDRILWFPDDYSAYKPAKEILPLRHSNISKLYVGGHNNFLYFFALNSRGEVYCWSDYCWSYHIGLSMRGEWSLPTPTLNSYLKNIKSLSLGINHSLALTTNHTVLSWGLNTYGQLGLPSPTDKTQVIPTLIDFNPQVGRIKKITAGCQFSLFLTDEGKLYGCGKYDRLQSSVPILIDIPHLRFTQLIAQQDSILAFNAKDGQWYGWGNSHSGQLGLPKQEVVELYPRQISNLKDYNIKKLSLGWDHILAGIL